MTEKSDVQKPSESWGGAFKAFSRAFEQVKANPRPALLFVGVYLIVTMIESTNPANSLKDVILFAGYEGLAVLIFLLALPTYALAIADRKQISLGDFMRFNARKYFAVLAVSILYGLIIMGSLFLLIIPVIWTAAWFALSTMLVVDKNLGPIAALKESKRLIQNHKAKVWGIIGVTILFSFGTGLISMLPNVGEAAAGLASGFITLLSTAATALLFRWAQHQDA